MNWRQMRRGLAFLFFKSIMNKRVIGSLFALALCIGIVAYACPVAAENEAVFDMTTWELNIPKLVVEPYAYDVTMKLVDGRFLLTDYSLNSSIHSASGTYSYNPGSGLLGLHFTESTFMDDGPPVGYFEGTIMSVTETRLTLRNPSGEIETWTRVSGPLAGLIGQWSLEEPGAKNLVEFSAGNTVNYSREYKYFSLQKKTISIDGVFSDWEERDRIYKDTDGPECGNVAGRDLQEVYVAYDDHFTYVRFVLNGSLDSTFGYKFGSEIHANAGNNRLQYASGSLLPHGVSLPDAFLAIRGNQFEYKIPTLERWHDRRIAAWLDQGTETVCRDHVTLPVLLGW